MPPSWPPPPAQAGYLTDLLNFLNRNAGAIQAVASVVSVLLTIGIVWVTIRQTKINARLVGVTEEQLILQAQMESTRNRVELFAGIVPQGIDNIRIANLNDVGVFLESVSVVRESPPPIRRSEPHVLEEALAETGHKGFPIFRKMLDAAEPKPEVNRPAHATLHFLVVFFARGKKWELRTQSYRCTFIHPGSAIQSASRVSGSKPTLSEITS